MDYKDKRKQIQNKTFFSSMHYATDGLKTSLVEEKNMKRHIFFGILALLAGIILKITSYEWLWIIAAIFLVIFSEILNTAIENLVDLVTDFEYHPIAKKVKDMMAGAVLLMSIFAIIIGMIIFIPKLLELL